MLLKCTRSMPTASMLTATGSEPCEFPFKLGEVYEVVEIFEHPYHVMARLPGATTWPKPGDPMFCWHPEDVFEPTDKPIEIVACVYKDFDAFNDTFGVIIEDQEVVAMVMELDDLPSACDEEEVEDYATWRARCASHLPEPITKAWHEIETAAEPMPFIADCDVEFLQGDMASLFVVVGFHYWELVEHDIRKADAADLIRQCLEKLGIACPEPDSLCVEGWCGDGLPRLIHSHESDEQEAGPQ